VERNCQLVSRVECVVLISGLGFVVLLRISEDFDFLGLGGFAFGRFGFIVWLDVLYVCERGGNMLRHWKVLRDGVVGRSRRCGLELRRGFAIGPHESKRARYYEGKGEADDGTPLSSKLHGVHVFQCRVSSSFSLVLNFCPISHIPVKSVGISSSEKDSLESPVFLVSF